MMKPELMLFLLFLCGSFTLVRLECKLTGEPEVAWNFDDDNATTLIPSYSKDERFLSDITDVNPSFVSGIVGNALHMQKSSIVLAKNLQADDCLLDVDACLEICISFWLKLKGWGNGGHILSTLPVPDFDKSKPGIFIGRGDSDKFTIYIRGENKDANETRFSVADILGHWARFQISFNTKNRVTTVLINETTPNTEVVSLILKPENVALSEIEDEKNPELMLGKKEGPDFYIDELKVYYTRNETTIQSTTDTMPIGNEPTTAATERTGHSIATTNPSPTTSEYSTITIEETGLSAGVIGGIVVGCIVGCAVLGLITFVAKNRKKIRNYFCPPTKNGTATYTKAEENK